MSNIFQLEITISIVDNILNMSDSGGEPKSKLSRRDFFKIMGVGGAAALAVGAGVEIGNDPHFVNALKVTKELTEAQISKDPERIYESRKLAMVWVFAETAAKYSEEMGLGGAGLTMEHYLYGNGEPLDISFILEKVTEMAPERFVGKLVSSAINYAESNIGTNISQEKDLMFTKRAVKELKSETGLKTAMDAREVIEWWEFYNAYGGAKYELHAPEAYIESVNMYGQHIVLEKGIEITATDRYHWSLEFEVSLDSKVSQVVEHVSESMFDQFYKSKDVVEKTIKDLGLSDEQVNKIMEIYSDEKKEETVSNLASGAYDFVKETTQSLIGQPDLVENDFNLLKKLGAMEYDMKGHLSIPNRIEIVV